MNRGLADHHDFTSEDSRDPGPTQYSENPVKSPDCKTGHSWKTAENAWILSGQNKSPECHEEAILAFLCFRQLKNDPERQSEIDPPLLTQKAVDQINLTQPIVS